MRDPLIVAEAACREHAASQDIMELAHAIEKIQSVGPKVIVEIGCDAGGTLWAWRQICERVYGITAADNGYEAGGSGRVLVPHGAVVRVGDSHDPASFDWLASKLGDDPVDVLVIDGDHTALGVWTDISMYQDLVRDGGLIMLHDILVIQDRRAEVHRVWDRLLHENLHLEEIEGPYGWGVIHVGERRGQ